MEAYKRYVIKITHYLEGTFELYDLIVPDRVSGEKVKQQVEMAKNYINVFMWSFNEEEKLELKKVCDKHFDLMFDLNYEGKFQDNKDVLWYYLKDICGYTVEKHRVDADFEVHW